MDEAETEFEASEMEEETAEQIDGSGKDRLPLVFTCPE